MITVRARTWLALAFLQFLPEGQGQPAATWSFGAGPEASLPGAVSVQQDRVSIDLSALPPDATVLRAVLHCEREGNHQDKVDVAAADQPDEPLALHPPRFHALQAGGAIKRAVALKIGKVEFLIKRFSGWKPSTLRLDVSFLGGKALHVIPSVSGLSARHRNGQTILTWKEVDPPTTAEEMTFQEWNELKKKLAEGKNQARYRIYRSREPISARALEKAELVDEVGPLTCWNPDYYGVYPKPEQKLLRYVVEEGGGPVPPATGIYAHCPEEPGKAFYAVTAALNGEEDLSTFSAENSLLQPIQEVVGPGDPILQRTEKPEQANYIQNPTSHYYVRWEAPPRSHVPSRPFDYRVSIPPEAARPAPIGLHLHCWGGNLDGGYIWWYKAPDGGILVSSNQIPYDWWVAYHEALGTWKEWSEGVTRDYTVKRLLAFVDWVATRWEVDLSRLFVTGASMGGSGAAMIAVRYPDRFAYSLSSVGVHNAAQSPQFTGSYEGVCGNVQSDYQHESGLRTFDYLSNAFLLRKDPKRRLPFISFTNGKNDGAIGWPQALDFARALQETRQPHLFTWGQGGHGQRVYVPTVTAGGDGGSTLKNYLDLRTDQSVPAFSNCSLDNQPGKGDPADGDPEGQFNLFLRWDTRDIVDEEKRYEITVYLIESAGKESCTVDLTPRRLQVFNPGPGETFQWVHTSLATQQAIQSGEAQADPWGLVTLEKLEVSKGKSRVQITFTKPAKDAPPPPPEAGPKGRGAALQPMDTADPMVTPPEEPAKRDAPEITDEGALPTPTVFLPETTIAPRLEGRLDDEVWKLGARLELAKTLDGGGPAAQPTEVRLLRDAANLYLAIRCSEPELEKLKGFRRARDENIWNDDSVEIFLCPSPGQPYFHFIINPFGSIYDGLVKDGAWNAEFQVAAAKGDGEWTVELAIPMKELIGPDFPRGEWAANFTRNRYVTGSWQESAWSPTLSPDSHLPERFGRLRFSSTPSDKADSPSASPKEDSQEDSAGGRLFQCMNGLAVIQFNLSKIPQETPIRRADLLLFRRKALTGRDPEALIDIEIFPLFQPFIPGKEARPETGPLALRPPWFDRMNVTEAVRQWVSTQSNAAFFVKTFPGWDPEATRLEIDSNAQGRPLPRPVNRIRVLHRFGQTFVLFEEIDDRSEAPAPLWRDLKKNLETMDAKSRVRYRVHRHDRPIDEKSHLDAELLAEVKPMSGYNTEGRSVDELIRLHRLRALEDLDFAKALARGGYFESYHPNMVEMGEVRIPRLAVEDGQPLPPRWGLYVHHPQQQARSYYGVVSVEDGVSNTQDFSPANSLQDAVEESVGPGQPILQGSAEVTVFFDYRGLRSRYVQWTASPLSHLPNQYYNWGLFMPEGFEKAEVKRLSLFFHDSTQRYLKPPWPHRQDTLLLSPHDAPFRSYGYGYHESLGTLRSFKQGRVQPFFARRVDSVLDWAVRKFGVDPGRLSCGGSGYWAGTAALQYGLRRPGTISYVMAEANPDPDPRQTPDQYSHYGRGDSSPTPRPEMDAVWGKIEWNIPAESGKPIWDELNLVQFALEVGPQRTLPFLSLGAGPMHLTWKQETDLMKAYLDTGNAFMSEFFWGSSSHLHLPVTATEGDLPFEPRANAAVLACRPDSLSPNPDFYEKQFLTGQRGYGAGSRINTLPRWDPEAIVDTPERLEMTLYSARSVVYAGHVTCPTLLRNTRAFQPRPGEKLAWSVIDLEKKIHRQGGETEADPFGRIPLPGLTFAEPARLILVRQGQ